MVFLGLSAEERRCDALQLLWNFNSFVIYKTTCTHIMHRSIDLQENPWDLNLHFVLNINGFENTYSSSFLKFAGFLIPIVVST